MVPQRASSLVREDCTSQFWGVDLYSFHASFNQMDLPPPFTGFASIHALSIQKVCHEPIVRGPFGFGVDKPCPSLILIDHFPSALASLHLLSHMVGLAPSNGILTRAHHIVFRQDTRVESLCSRTHELDVDVDRIMYVKK